MASTGSTVMTTASFYDDNDTSNVTTMATEEPELDRGLYIAYNSMLIAITIIIMFSMGTGVTVAHLKTIFTRPVGPIVGFFCQCLIMPACCCGYALLLDLAPNIAIGMVLTGSTPGGTISNIITFWAKADIVLSVCMTAISTTLAIGFLPLNMFLYSRFWTDENSQIPYENMVFTILYLWAAVIIGFFVGRRWPKTIPYFTKIGSIVALILILSAGFIQSRLYPELFELTWQTYLAGGTMPIIGFAIGFILASIFCLGIKQKLAIGFETGIQNTSLALTVIAVTYKSSFKSSYYSQFIILYTTVQVVLGIAGVILIWIYNLIRYRETPCTTKKSFGMDPSAPIEIQVGPKEPGHVTVDDSEHEPQLVSVYSSTDNDDNHNRLQSMTSPEYDVIGLSTADSPPPQYETDSPKLGHKQKGYDRLRSVESQKSANDSHDSSSIDVSDDKKSTASNNSEAGGAAAPSPSSSSSPSDDQV